MISHPNSARSPPSPGSPCRRPAMICCASHSTPSPPRPPPRAPSPSLPRPEKPRTPAPAPERPTPPELPVRHRLMPTPSPPAHIALLNRHPIPIVLGPRRRLPRRHPRQHRLYLLLALGHAPDALHPRSG